MDAPKKLADFYQHAVNVLYALVITQCFLISSNLFFPEKAVPFTDTIIRIFVLIFVNFFIVTSWIGYFKSITRHEHTTGRTGVSRFCLDLILIFLYYLLILCVSNNSYDYIFMYLLPLIAGTYVVWDFLKWLEYRPNKEEWNTRFNRRFISIVFFIGILFQTVIYVNPIFFPWKFDYILASCIALALTYFYRRRKWLVIEDTG